MNSKSLIDTTILDYLALLLMYITNYYMLIRSKVRNMVIFKMRWIVSFEFWKSKLVCSTLLSSPKLMLLNLDSLRNWRSSRFLKIIKGSFETQRSNCLTSRLKNFTIEYFIFSNVCVVRSVFHELALFRRWSVTRKLTSSNILAIFLANENFGGILNRFF